MGVASNTWSRFPVPVINSFVCETDEIDICAFPFCKYSSVFGRFENTDSSSKCPLMILYSKGINLKIAIALVNSILLGQVNKLQIRSH